MATWQSLGVITPELNQWQSFLAPTYGGETFRVSFFNLGVSAENRRWASFAVIDSIWDSGQSGSSVRVYPAIDSEVIVIPIPPEFKAVGKVVRSLRIKKFFRRRLGRVVEPGWGIELEEFRP